MTEEPILNSDSGEQRCALCGTRQSLTTRFVSICATTVWEKTLNGRTETLTTKDGLRTWLLSLCPSCITEGYTFSLKSKIIELIIKSIFSIIVTPIVIFGALRTNAIISPEYFWYYPLKAIFGIFSIVLLLLCFSSFYLLFLAYRDSKAYSNKSISSEELAKGKGFFETAKLVLEKVDLSLIPKKYYDKSERGDAYGKFEIPEYLDKPQQQDEGATYKVIKRNDRKILRISMSSEEVIPKGWIHIQHN